LEEANALAEEQLDTARDSYDKLEELNETAKESYTSLYSQIGEVILAEE
jgi:hypothetical protein